MIQVRDELSALDGRRRRDRCSASATTACGSGSIPTSWPSRNMTAGDVVNAIREQNARWPRGQIGQPPVRPGQHDQITLATLGRLTEPEQFEDIIVKRTPRRPRRAHQGRGPRRTGRQERGRQRTRRTASRRAAWPSSSFPTPTPWTPPTASGQDGRAEKDFPDGVDYEIRYDTTPYIARVDQRGVQDAARRHHPRGARGAGVPAELAVGDHSAGRRAGGHHRHLRGHGGDRLQPQQPDALRAGAGDRHRGGRRHRRRRGGRASHRARACRRARRRSWRWTRCPGR